MTILDQLAGCARERTGQAKLRISLEELKQQALSLPKGNFTFEKAISDEIAQLIIKSIDYTEEHYGKTKYIFVKKEDPLRPFQYSMLQHRVMQMIRKNDIRDENGELLNFGTHTFRHCYGKKLTEMHIDDWMIARLLGHKTLQSVHHYRKIGNKIMADETRAVREKIDMILMDVVKEWDGYEI